MRQWLWLSLALFRTSWLRSLATILGIAGVVGIVTGVLLVINAFQTSADEQLDGIFSRYDYVVVSDSGAALSAETLRRVSDLPVDDVVPVVQQEARLDGHSVVLVVLPSDRAATGGSRLPLVVSSQLATTLPLHTGQHETLQVGSGSIPAVISEPAEHNSTTQALDRASFVVATVPDVTALAGPELARPNLLLLRAGDVSAAELRAAVRTEPVLVQDRGQAQDALLSGMRTVLQTMPLVALIAGLLGVVLVFTVIRTSTITQQRGLLLLRALGARARTVRSLAITSALIHAGAGALLGLAGARPLAQSLLESIPASTRNSAAQVISIEQPGLLLTALCAVVLVVAALSAAAAVRPLLRRSAEDSLRAGEGRGSRLLVIGALAGTLCGVGAFVLLREVPADWLLALLMLMLGWFLVSLWLVPALFRAFSAALRVSRAGFLSTPGPGVASGQLSASAVTISGAVALLVALSGAAVNLERSALPTLKGMSQISLIVQDSAVDDLPTLRNLPEEVATTLGTVPGVTAVEPIQMGYVYLGGSRVLVQAAASDSRLPTMVQGRERSGELQSGQVYVSTQIAKDLGVTAGQRIDLPGASGTALVKGVIDSFLWPNGVLVSTTEDSERWWGSSGYSALEVRGDASAAAVRTALRSDSQLSGRTMQVFTGAQAATQAETVVVNSGQLYQALSTMGLLVAMLVAAGAITLDVSTRSREFGVVRAIGARWSQLSGMVVLRAVALIGSGTLVGLVFGLLLQYYLARVAVTVQGLPISMHWAAAPVGSALLAAVLVVVVSSLGSILRLVRASPPALLGAAD